MSLNKVKYTREEYRKEYLKSDEWKNLRTLVLGVNPDCQCCKKTIATEVHHMVYRNLVDIKVTDLLPVCRDCHNFIHKAISDDYISQDSNKIEEIRSKTLNILHDEEYSALHKWLGEKHSLSENEIKAIKEDSKHFIIKRISGLIKKNIWYGDLSERKFTGRQILKIQKVIETSKYRMKNKLDKIKSYNHGRLGRSQR